MKPDRRQGGAPLPFPDEGRGCLQQTTLYACIMNGLTDNWMSWFPSLVSHWALASAIIALVVTLIAGILGGWRFLIRRREDDGTEVIVRLLDLIHRRREHLFVEWRSSARTIDRYEHLLASVREEVRNRSYFHRHL